MRLTRRQVVAGAGAAALGGSIYELVDRLTRAPQRTVAVPKLPVEQHLLEGQRVVQSNGVEVLVPPLHHRVVTARVAATDLKAAQRDLEQALAELDRRYPSTPAGLGVTLLGACGATGVSTPPEIASVAPRQPAQTPRPGSMVQMLMHGDFNFFSWQRSLCPPSRRVRA